MNLSRKCNQIKAQSSAVQKLEAAIGNSRAPFLQRKTQRIPPQSTHFELDFLRCMQNVHANESKKVFQLSLRP